MVYGISTGGKRYSFNRTVNQSDSLIMMQYVFYFSQAVQSRNGMEKLFSKTERVGQGRFLHRKIKLFFFYVLLGLNPTGTE